MSSKSRLHWQRAAINMTSVLWNSAPCRRSISIAPNRKWLLVVCRPFRANTPSSRRRRRFVFTIGVDQDPTLAALELDLVEKPEPEGEIEDIDPAAVLEKALGARPEIAAANAAVANDETNIRLAHNALEPDLSLSGFYQSNGIGGNQYNLNTGQLIATGGLGAYRTASYLALVSRATGGTLTLNLPLRNRGAKANLGTALVARRHDLYASQVNAGTDSSTGQRRCSSDGRGEAHPGRGQNIFGPRPKIARCRSAEIRTWRRDKLFRAGFTNQMHAIEIKPVTNTN